MFILLLLEYFTVLILAVVLVDYVADYVSYIASIKKTTLSSIANTPVSLNICCFFNASIIFYMGMLARESNLCIFLLSYVASVLFFIPVKYSRLASMYVLQTKDQSIVGGLLNQVFRALVFAACASDVCLYSEYVSMIPGVNHIGLVCILGAFTILPLFHKMFAKALDFALLILAIVTIGFLAALAFKINIFSTIIHISRKQDSNILYSVMKGVLVALASFEPLSFCGLATIDHVRHRVEKNDRLDFKVELATVSCVTGFLNIIISILCGTVTIYAYHSRTTMFDLAKTTGLYNVILISVLIFALINQYGMYCLVASMGKTLIEKFSMCTLLAIMQAVVILSGLGTKMYVIDTSYAAANIAQIILTVVLVVKSWRIFKSKRLGK